MVKGYEWLLVTDHKVWVSAGVGWSDCMQNVVGEEAGELGPPSSWQALSLSVDQVADGWGAAWFLMMGKKAGALLMKDASHRLCSDTLLALGHSGPRPAFALMTCILKASHGPWAE